MCWSGFWNIAKLRSCFHPIYLKSTFLRNFKSWIILRRDKVILMHKLHEKFYELRFFLLDFILHFGFWQLEKCLLAGFCDSQASRMQQSTAAVSDTFISDDESSCAYMWLDLTCGCFLWQKVSNFKRSWSWRPARKFRGNFSLWISLKF